LLDEEKGSDIDAFLGNVVLNLAVSLATSIGDAKGIISGGENAKEWPNDATSSMTEQNRAVVEAQLSAGVNILHLHEREFVNESGFMV